MNKTLHKKKLTLARKILSTFISITFISSMITPPSALVYAQSAPATVLNLPVPGTMVGMTDGFTPLWVKGITIHPENPLEFDFIIDQGDAGLEGVELRKEITKVIKYFLASITVPNEELWVNLSPYEQDRIIAKGFGDTEMGRDLLAQDYLLKQLTASLMYPEDELGKKFWRRVYDKAYAKYGTTEIPMNTFNKIWIVPEKANIYIKDNNVLVADSHLKVMLEEDYVALQNNIGVEKYGLDSLTQDDAQIVSGLSSAVVREFLIPEIEREVNQGKTFANLRQIYNASILATWYKINLQESLLGQVYADKGKTKGIDTKDKQINTKIYDQYVESFKKGVYNYIREDYDPATQKQIPRKYFSGGYDINSSPIIQEVASTGELDKNKYLHVNSLAQALDAKNIKAGVLEEVAKINSSPIDIEKRHERWRAVQEKINNEVLTQNQFDDFQKMMSELNVQKKEEQAVVYWLLKQNIEAIREGDKIKFKGVGDEVTINEEGIYVSDRIIKGIQVISQGALISDIDGTLAPREEPLVDETLFPMHHLLMYDILAPHMITANEESKATKRLAQYPLGEVPQFNADGGVNLYKFENGKYVGDEDFRETMNVAVSDNDYSYLKKEIFEPLEESWKKYSVVLAKKLSGRLENGSLPSEKEVEKFLYLDMGEFIEKSVVDHIATYLGYSTSRDFFEAILNLGKMSNGEAMNHQLDEIRKNFKSTKNLINYGAQFYQILAYTEIIRILHSELEKDEKQKRDIKTKYLKLNEDGEPLEGIFNIVHRAGVQIAIKPIRPGMVRDEIVGDMMEAVSNSKLGRAYTVRKGGSTTADIVRSGAGKHLLVKYNIEQNDLPVGYTAFFGDEYLLPGENESKAGVDDTVALLGKEKGYEDLMVFDFSNEGHDESRNNVLWSTELEITNEKTGPEGAGKVLDFVLENVEESIRQLLTTPEYKPVPVMAKLREALDLPEIQGKVVESSQMPAYMINKVKNGIMKTNLYIPELEGWINLEEEINATQIYYTEGTDLASPSQGVRINVNFQSIDNEEEVAREILLNVLIKKLKQSGVKDANEVAAKILKRNFKNIYHSSKSVSMTNIVGGTGGNFVARFKEIFVKAKKSKIAFLISPFDDGGGSRRLLDEIKNIFGVWTPPAGDQMNIIAGLSHPFLKSIIRDRINKNEYKDVETLSRAIEVAIKRAKTDPKMGDQQLSDTRIEFVQHELKQYIDYIDEYIKDGKISLKEQSIGNLLHAAVMMKEGAYTKDGINQKKYRRGLDVLMYIFGVENVKIIMSSFEEATLYSVFRDFEVGTEKEPLRKALEIGKATKIKMSDGSEKKFTITKNSAGVFELKIDKLPEYVIEITEDFGDYISRDKSVDGKSPSKTTVQVLKNGEKVDFKMLLNGELVDILDVSGKSVNIVTDDFTINFKGRLVIGQTQITDGLNHSEPIDFGFIDGKIPTINSEAVEILENTSGMVSIGPGSLLTSILAVLTTGGISEQLEKLTKKIPVVWIQNPITDNETVGMSFNAVANIVKKSIKNKFSKIINWAIIDNINKSIKKLSDEDRKLLDESSNKKEEIKLRLAKKSSEAVSYIAKLKRGPFSGDSSLFKQELEEAGVKVIHKDMLTVIGREVRGGKADVTVGFPLEELAAQLEEILYRGMHATVYWQALISGGLTESALLRLLNDMSSLYPRMSLIETLKSLYNLKTTDRVDLMNIPMFDLENLNETRKKVLITNFAGTQGSAGGEHAPKVPDALVKAYESFLNVNPKSIVIIRTGLDLKELKVLFLDKIEARFKKQIVVASNYGATIYEFNEEGEELVNVKINVSDSQKKEAWKMISEEVDRFEFSVQWNDVFGDEMPETVKLIRKRELQVVVELEPWLLHPILKLPKFDNSFSDIREEFVTSLNNKLKNAQLPFVVKPVGIGAVNIVFESIPPLNQLIDQKLKERFRSKVESSEMMFLGQGFSDVAKQYDGATQIIFNPSKTLKDSKVQLYPTFGPNGFVDLLVRMSEVSSPMFMKVDNNKNYEFALKIIKKVYERKATVRKDALDDATKLLFEYLRVTINFSGNKSETIYEYGSGTKIISYEEDKKDILDSKKVVVTKELDKTDLYINTENISIVFPENYIPEKRGYYRFEVYFLNEELKVNLLSKFNYNEKVQNASSAVSKEKLNRNKKGSFGGINLNPELLDMQIRRDGNGVPLPIWEQDIGAMHIEGFVPIILNIMPVNLPQLLGLVADVDGEVNEGAQDGQGVAGEASGLLSSLDPLERREWGFLAVLDDDEDGVLI